MRDVQRIKLIAVLRAVWDQNPDWRLGQLIGNAIGIEGRIDPFYVEDDEMERLLRELARRLNTPADDA